jgi:hypothetical protein
MPIRLYNRDTGAVLGDVTPEQLEELGEFLEQEGPEEHEYWINNEELEVMEEEGLDPILVKLLKDAVVAAGEDGIEIEWRDE